MCLIIRCEPRPRAITRVADEEAGAGGRMEKLGRREIWFEVELFGCVQVGLCCMMGQQKKRVWAILLLSASAKQSVWSMVL